MLNPASQLRSELEATLQKRVPHAFSPPQRSGPEMLSTGIASVDAITGGIPLGCLTEICGATSSGRTSIVLAVIASSMRAGHVCAYVDATDAFDPQSAKAAGVDLGRLLWIRGSGDRAIGPSGEVKAKHAKMLKQSSTSPDGPITRSPDFLKATDLLLQAGGFGIVILDLADVSVNDVRRIPLTTWFRFRRAVENTSTAFIVVEQQPHANSCASLVMDLTARHACWSEASTRQRTNINAAGSAQSFESTGEAEFRVTPEGIAIPFEKSEISSFLAPQRELLPHARLLDTCHVHLQVTRSRGLRAVEKFPSQPDRNIFQHTESEAQTKAFLIS
jgi:hypothetical protein